MFHIVANLLIIDKGVPLSGVYVFVSHHSANTFNRNTLRQTQFRSENVPSDVECGLVLGGDGTLIRAIRDLEGEELPLLGINLGTLGYLAEVELKDYQYAIDRLC